MGEKRLEIPFYARYLLTVNEAACYFNIGAKKMRTLVSEHEGAKWMIYNGNRIMIKRELFASWLDQQTGSQGIEKKQGFICKTVQNTFLLSGRETDF